MINISFQDSSAPEAEYTVYAFEYDMSGRKLPRRWLRKDTHVSMAEAVKQAKILFRSGQYPRIEIKRKYFDSKSNRNIDMTLKTLEPGKNIFLRLILTAAFSLACGLVALVVAYFLNHDGSF